MFRDHYAYPSDMNDAQWEIIEPLIPSHKRGRKRKACMRSVMNAIFYLVREGCRWRALPKDFPKWTLVKYYYYSWVENGDWEKINLELIKKTRVMEGREADPSAGIIDSQSLKSSEWNDERGIDGNKKVKGTKIQILVDVLGLLVKVRAHPANGHDGKFARILFDSTELDLEKLKHIWVDGGYQGDFQEWLLKEFGILVEVVKSVKSPDHDISLRKKTEKEKQEERDQQQYLFDVEESYDPKIPLSSKKELLRFKIVKWRWIVERTFAWLKHNRRLSRNYERKNKSLETNCYIGMMFVTSRRLAKNQSKIIPLPSSEDVSKTIVSETAA